MSDKMVEAFEKFKEGNESATELQLFQAGYSASAVSMRERALEVVKDTLGNVPNQNDLTNSLLNGIGELPDIAE